MIVTERKTDVFNQRAGGKGETIMEHIVDEKLYGGKIITYARVILKPGCSLGLHKHVGTSETMTCYRAPDFITITARKARCTQAT